MKKFHLTLKFLLLPLGRTLFPCRIMDKGEYKKYDRGQVLISNHLSWMDVCYHLFWLPGYKRVLSKKENEGRGLKRWFLRQVGILFVNRDKPELSSMRECITSLKNGETLSIFPEGTRNKVNREIMEMHSGAAMFALKGDASVVPVVVHHKAKMFRRNYVGIGDRIDISDLYGKRMDETTLDEAMARFRVGMQNTLDKLDKWVAEKGWKKDKKIAREKKRALKAEYKRAKKAYKRAAKA